MEYLLYFWFTQVFCRKCKFLKQNNIHLYVVFSTISCFQVKRWVELQDNYVAIPNIDVPAALYVVRIVGWMIGGAEAALVTMKQSTTACNFNKVSVSFHMSFTEKVLFAI